MHLHTVIMKSNIYSKSIYIPALKNTLTLNNFQ